VEKPAKMPVIQTSLACCFFHVVLPRTLLTAPRLVMSVILLDWILIGALDGARLVLEVDPLILFVDWSGFEIAYQIWKRKFWLP
jgi:hypothetical protein